MPPERVCVFKRYSPLTHPLTGRDGANGERRFQFAVAPMGELLLLASHLGKQVAFAQELNPLLGSAPTPATHTEQRLTNSLLLQVAPGQHWCLTTDTTLANTLATRRFSAGSVTSLSHSRVRVVITGSGIPDLLSKGISVDLDPTQFVVGQFAQTALEHIGILLHRRGDDRYELYLPSTFARTLWEWLLDAAMADGYHLLAP